MQDRDSSQVSYPRVLTRNNREVVIRSVINQPVLASTSSVTPGIGGTTTASVSYLPIGTIINVLPKQMDDGVDCPQYLNLHLKYPPAGNHRKGTFTPWRARGSSPQRCR